MATFKCPDCKTKVSTSAESCPKCGRPVTDTDRTPPAKPKRWQTILAGLFVLAILGIMFGPKDKKPATPPATEQSSAAANPCAGVNTIEDWNKASTLWRTNNPQCKPKEDAQKHTIVSAPALFNAFAQNEVAADQKYKGKRVAIEGIIYKIEKSPLGYPELVFDVSYGINTVKCQFSKDNMDRIANMSKGQRVVLIGTVKAFTLGALLSVDDCEFPAKK